MIEPVNIDLTALFAEKCRQTGSSWIHRYSGKSQQAAVEHFSMLMHRYRAFYTGLKKEEIYDQLDELIYQLSADGSAILSIAFYRELTDTSLADAYHKQKEIMARRGTAAAGGENLLTTMKLRAAHTGTLTAIEGLVQQSYSSACGKKIYSSSNHPHHSHRRICIPLCACCKGGRFETPVTLYAAVYIFRNGIGVSNIVQGL